MPLRPIYYDTETTGTRPQADRIVEIAAFDPVRNQEFEMLVNPAMPIPKEAAAVHGITDEMVENAPPFEEVAKQFVTFCEGEVVLVAHNHEGFDKHFLREEFARANVPLPEWLAIDTLKWARKYRPDLPRHALQFLREVFGIAANNAHRALDDVKVLHAVFEQMIDDLTWKQITTCMGSGSLPTHMPFGKHRGTPLSEVPGSYLRWLKGSGALDKGENADLKAAIDKLGLLQPA